MGDCCTHTCTQIISTLNYTNKQAHVHTTTYSKESLPHKMCMPFVIGYANTAIVLLIQTLTLSWATALFGTTCNFIEWARALFGTSCNRHNYISLALLACTMIYQRFGSKSIIKSMATSTNLPRNIYLLHRAEISAQLPSHHGVR